MPKDQPAEPATLGIKYKALSEIKRLPKNVKRHDLAAIIESLQAFGMLDPIGINEETGHDYDGNGRADALVAMKERGLDPPKNVLAKRVKQAGKMVTEWFVPTISGVSMDQITEARAALAMNRANERGGVDPDLLAAVLADLEKQDQLAGTGYDSEYLRILVEQSQEKTKGHDADRSAGGSSGAAAADPAAAYKTLAERFLVPPFSVLDARQGYWQTRKRAWIDLGIQSEVGRGANLLQFSDTITAGLKPGDDFQGQRAERTDKIDGLLFGSLSASDPDFYRKKAQAEKRLGREISLEEFVREHYSPEKYGTGKRLDKVNGLYMKSDSGNDPAFYLKKQEVEARLGREISTEEFKRDHYEGPASYASGTSIFDPVLCELAYRWWSPEGGQVLDPFAGGSVRGIVAEKLGRKYVGVDLSAAQIEANHEQAKRIGVAPLWLQGDSRHLSTVLSAAEDGLQADFIFSCPPYFDLEKYSEDPADLSGLSWEEFLDGYFMVIDLAVRHLKQDRFACFVIGDVRDKKGIYRNLPGETIKAFQAAGCDLYNEAVLVTAVGSLPIRAGRQFQQGRKLGKTHQNVLVFCKGDGKRATEACGLIDFSTGDDPFGEAIQGAAEPLAEAPLSFAIPEGGEV